jgi:hypothetical protein
MHSLEIIRKMNDQAVSLSCKPDYFEEGSYGENCVSANNNHRLLNITQALDVIMAETLDLPGTLKQSIILARDNFLKLLVEDQERGKNIVQP